jgi:hypothetical protein
MRFGTLQNVSRNSFTHLDAVYPRRQNATGIACTFTSWVQTFEVGALQALIVTRNAQG